MSFTGRQQHAIRYGFNLIFREEMPKAYVNVRKRRTAGCQRMVTFKHNVYKNIKIALSQYKHARLDFYICKITNIKITTEV